MKTRILLPLLLLAVSCNHERKMTTEVVILNDVTDKRIALPSTKDVWNLYGFDTNKWNGGVFRYMRINEVSLNQVTLINVAPDDPWNSNEFDRDDSIYSFLNAISNTIGMDFTKTPSLNNSSIYVPIAKELTRLSKSSSEVKMMLVYSDLMEHMPELSFYNKKQFNLLKNNPDSLQHVLERQCELPNLSGITVAFIFQPTTVEEDSKFRIVSAFYTKMLEDKGAIVKVAASPIP